MKYPTTFISYTLAKLVAPVRLHFKCSQSFEMLRQYVCKTIVSQIDACTDVFPRCLFPYVRFDVADMTA